MLSTILRTLLLLAACAAVPLPATAQETHAEMLGRMTGDCLMPVAASADSFRVTFDEAPAILRTILLSRWLDDGRTVLADETADDVTSRPAAHLVVSIDEADVALERAGRGMLERAALVAVQYRFTAASGRVLAADTCRSSERDAFDRDRAGALAHNGYSGTSPEIPTTSRFRRIVEPVIVTGAAAIGTYLFFNLRSRRSDN